jgi:uncharacterized SAM-binding protein YcdF (DUF218 family)
MTDQEINGLLFVGDGPEPADVALVFGSIEPDEACQRVRHAAGLYRSGLVPRLLVSGGGSHRGDTATEAGFMFQIACELGVPREAILVEDHSRNTFENVANSVAMLRELDLLDATRTVLLVSCPWHMRRVSLIARAEFPTHVRMRCCPHTESCAAGSWVASWKCRERVVGEAQLLTSFFETGILPSPEL